MRKGFTLIELMIVVAIIAVIAAIAIPNLVQSRIASNETSAVASCVVCLAGQATFHKTDYYGNTELTYASPNATGGMGVIDMWHINGDVAETKVGLVDRSMAASWVPATGADANPLDTAAGATAKAGYLITDLLQDAAASAPYVAAVEFAVHCYPGSFERGGRNEFTMDTGGTVYQRIAGGGGATAPDPGSPAAKLTSDYYPDVSAGGWIAVGGG